MFVFTVDVSFSTVRPIRPDQFTSRVTLLAESDHEAHVLACLMVASRPGVEMVTRSEITNLVL